MTIIIACVCVSVYYLCLNKALLPVQKTNYDVSIEDAKVLNGMKRNGWEGAFSL